MKKSKLLLSFTIVFLLLSAFVFAQAPFKKPYQDYEIVCGVGGGQLIIPTTSDPKSFNPIVAQETSTTSITSYIFEGLTKTNPITLEVEPNLARSWDVSEDGKVWTFYLKEGVFFNDGVELSAKDVVFTFKSLIYNPNIPTSSKDTFTVEGKEIKVKALDKYKVEFKLPFVFAPFLRALSHDILPAHKYQELVRQGKFSFALGLDSKPQDIVGTGPFLLSDYLPGERVILKKNPFYHKKDSCGQKLPYLDEILFVILANPDTALLKFIEREIDYYSLRPQDLGILGPEQEKDNFTIYNAGPSYGSNFIVFNQNGKKSPKGKPFVEPYKLKWFQNQDFRQAIAYAINRDKIIDLLMNGLGKPQYSPVSEANTFYHSQDVKAYPYSPEKAKTILKSIGFRDRDSDGVLEDTKQRNLAVSLFTNANDTQRVQIATLIKKDLEKIGVDVHFLALDFNNLVAKLTATFDWEMILIGLTGGIEPYFGKNVWSYKGNLHMWNPTKEPIADYEIKIEEIFNQAAKTLDDEKRKELFNKWQQIVSYQVPLVYTVTPYSIYAVRDRFGNLYPTIYGGAFSQIEHIYIEK